MADSATLLQKLNDKILESYDTVTQKGGTAPSDKNMDNLPAAIKSIPEGGGGSSDPYDVPYFDGGEYGAIAYIGPDGEVAYHYFTENENYSISSGGSGSGRAVEIVIDGYKLNASNILSFSFGTKHPSISTSYIFYNCTMLRSVYNTEKASGASVGSSFLYGCTLFNSPIKLPDTVTSIGSEFLSGCTSFNSSIYIPDSVVTVNSSFLYSCKRFNQPIELPVNLTKIGSLFLAVCSSFNSSISWRTERAPETPLAVDTDFMRRCSSFNQPISDFTKRITSFALSSSSNQAFMQECVLFNQPIEFNSGITYIPQEFLMGCTSFNQPIIIPALVTDLGGSSKSMYYFLRECASFNSPVTFLGQPTGKLTNFLYACTSYNQPVVLPESITEVTSFLYNCINFNSPITAPGLVDAGNYFLYGNKAITKEVPLPPTVTTIGGYFMSSSALESWTIPANIASIGDYFLYNANNLQHLTIETATLPTTSTRNLATTSSTDPVYTMGIELDGPGAEAWIAAMPSSTSSPYRKLYLPTDIVYLLYTDINGRNYKLTERNDKSTFLSTWCGSGTSSAAEVHYQPGVSTLTEVTTLPRSGGTSSSNGFLANCKNATIDGLEHFTNLTAIGGYFLYGVADYGGKLPDLSNVETIGNYFLGESSALLPEGGLKLGDKLTTIGNNFLYRNTDNQPIILPASLTTIGSDFMFYCRNFTHPLTIPDAVTSVGNIFMSECNNFTGPLNVGRSSGISSHNSTLATNLYSAPMFAQGVTLTGENAQIWKDTLPDRTNNTPYRKLIVAS